MLPIELTGAAGVYFRFLAFMLGAALGSFLHCAAWRIARKEDFFHGRSRCPRCGHVLGARELVPVLSWLAQRGRCRWCMEKIPPRYLAAEVFFGLVGLACLNRFGPGIEFLRNLTFLSCLFCLSLVDLDIGEIPNGCLAAAVLAWAATAPFLFESWGEALLRVAAGVAYGAGVLLLALLMDWALKKESMGGGDVKLFAVAGLYLGFAGTLFTLVFSCVLGLFCAALLGRRRGEPFPFGPAISAAAAGMLLYGEGLADWYLKLLL